jgi:hypothetical protein
MPSEKKSKSTGEVLCVYLAYWLAFGLFVGGLACTRIVGVLSFYLSLLVGVTFLFVYDCKDRIKTSPLRFMAAFLLLVALMLLPLKSALDSSFTYFSIVALPCIGITFAYTFCLRERISRSPWKYLLAFILLFFSMMIAIMSFP